MQAKNLHTSAIPERKLGAGVISGAENSSPQTLFEAMLAQQQVEQSSAAPAAETAVDHSTLNLRESLSVLGGSGTQAGEQLGFHGLGNSGVIFGQEDRTREKYQQQLQKLEAIKSERAAQATPTAEVSITTVETTYRQKVASEIEQRRLEIRRLTAQTNSAPTGTATTIHLQTDEMRQNIQHLDLSSLPVLKSIAQHLRRALEAKNNPALVVNQRNQAKKGPNAFEGAGVESKADMVGAMQERTVNRAKVEAVHEFSIGE